MTQLEGQIRTAGGELITESQDPERYQQELAKLFPGEIKPTTHLRAEDTEPEGFKWPDAGPSYEAVYEGGARLRVVDPVGFPSYEPVDAIAKRAKRVSDRLAELANKASSPEALFTHEVAELLFTLGQLRKLYDQALSTWIDAARIDKLYKVAMDPKEELG